MRPVLQIRLVKRPTSLISSDQLCQLSNFIQPVCHAMRLGLAITSAKLHLKKSTFFFYVFWNADSESEIRF